MSNLCYNCGNCHLPKPCGQGLKYCEICKNYGHAFNFCPTSVKAKDPNYQYWALCHNCDAWHLPAACQYALHKCAQCGCGGHKEYFCPVNPISRLVSEDKQETGVKRQRTDEDGGKRDIDDQTAASADTMRRVKAEAIREVFFLLESGYTKEQISISMTGAAQSHAQPVHAQSFMSAPTATTTTHPNLGYATPATPSNTVSSTQHDRFNNGELMQATNAAYQAPYTAPVAATKSPAPRKKAAPKKRNNKAQTAAAQPSSDPVHQTDLLSVQAYNDTASAANPYQAGPYFMSSQAPNPLMMAAASNVGVPKPLDALFEPRQDLAKTSLAALLNNDQNHTAAQITANEPVAPSNEEHAQVQGQPASDHPNSNGVPHSTDTDNHQGGGIAANATQQLAHPMGDQQMVGTDTVAQSVETAAPNAQPAEKTKKPRARNTKRKN